MIYVKIKGGLGNMFFQIAAGISFSIKRNCQLCLLDLFKHLKYLDDDDIYQPKLKHSSEYLKLNQFNKFINGSEKIEKVNYYDYPFQYVDIVPYDNSVIHGFFQSEKYFKDQRKEILQIFTPPEEIKKILQKYDFLKYKTTSIHVRRGDYLNNPDLHTVQNKAYFEEAINITKKYTEKYIIFSDDIEWCKNNFIGKDFIFIENEKDYIEIYLMSYCNNNIISNSSFGWWGAWMNENENKIIISPKKWFGPKNINFTDIDIIPENWIKI